MKPEEIAEEVGQALKTGFGPRVAIGMIIGLLKPVTAKQCHDYIAEKKLLLYFLTDEDWGKYARHAKGVNIDEITYEAVYKRLEKRRPDLVAAIINTPGGREWLRDSLENLKAKVRHFSA